MGRLVAPDEQLRNTTSSQVQQVVDENIKKLITNSASPYTRHLEEKPNFVTYLQLNMPMSTRDKGLENVEKFIGHHSPNKFNKINNFPLYGLSQMSIDLDNSNGLEIENYNTEAVILPNTIKPYPGDVIVIPYIGQEFLFIVESALFDQIKAKPFWKVTLSLQYRRKLEDYKDSIVEEYDFLYENIGTENKPLLKKRISLNLSFAEAIYDKLLEKFIKNYYVKELNCFLATFCVKPVYNSYLNKFLIDNQLLKFYKKEFFNSYYIEEFLPTDYTFEVVYNSSPYKMVEERNPKLKVERNRMLFQKIFLEENPLNMYGKECISVVLVGDGNKDGRIIWNKEFLDHINSGAVFNKTLKKYFLSNFIIEYLNGKDIFEDETNLQYLNEWNIYDDYTAYINIPFILKILKHSINLHKKTWNTQSLV